jgi:hypothetical protein
MALGGAAQAVWLLAIYPPLQRRFGTGNVLRICAFAWPIFFVIHPFANIALRHGSTLLFWTAWPIMFCLLSGCAMAFSKYMYQL